MRVAPTTNATTVMMHRMMIGKVKSAFHWATNVLGRSMTKDEVGSEEAMSPVQPSKIYLPSKSPITPSIGIRAFIDTLAMEFAAYQPSPLVPPCSEIILSE